VLRGVSVSYGVGSAMAATAAVWLHVIELGAA